MQLASAVSPIQTHKAARDSLSRSISDTLLSQQEAVQPVPVARELHTPSLALLVQKLEVKVLAIVSNQHRDTSYRAAALLAHKLQEAAQHFPAGKLDSHCSGCMCTTMQEQGCRGCTNTWQHRSCSKCCQKPTNTAVPQQLLALM